jgi:hypothetical protein
MAKRKNSAQKRTKIQKEADKVIEEIKKDENVSDDFKHALKVKSRFVPFIKMEDGAKHEYSIVQIEGNDYVEFKNLQGVYFNKTLFA